MSSVELRNKTQKTVFDGTEWVFIQNADSPYLVQKITLEDLRGATGFIVGSSMRTEATLIPISATFPWLCLSYPSVDLTTANYSTEFIDALRSRKYIYDEFGTSPVSAFSGSWSSNVFTLANNAANNAMLAELAEDWLYHGSPVTNFRILRSNGQDYNITNITVATRKITVNIDGSATSGTSIEIFTNRVYRDETKARHFSEAGLATYQAGGGKSGRLFRRDQMQRITGQWLSDSVTREMIVTQDDPSNTGKGAATVKSGLTSQSIPPSGSGHASRLILDTANSPDSRASATTDGETRAKSSSDYRYIYVGSYTS